MYQYAIFTTKYTLQDIYKRSGFSSCIAILCVCDERPTRCKTRCTCHDIPVWLKNEVSSHSYIGHWSKDRTQTTFLVSRRRDVAHGQYPKLFLNIVFIRANSTKKIRSEILWHRFSAVPDFSSPEPKAQRELL